MFILAKCWTRLLLKFWDLNGARVYNSCRSRKMLRNEYFNSSIYLQWSASIQQRTSPSKFWGDLFISSILSLLSPLRFPWLPAHCRHRWPFLHTRHGSSPLGWPMPSGDGLFLISVIWRPSSLGHPWYWYSKAIGKDLPKLLRRTVREYYEANLLHWPHLRRPLEMKAAE